MVRLLRPELLLLPLLTLLPPGAQAHETKQYDLNGGHYDDAGTYHCHTSFCRPTEHRYQRRRRIVNNVDDMRNYYLEEDWPHWEIMGGGCQDARNAILALTSRVPVTWSNPRQCTVREGLWVDPYTGEEFTRAGELEVDHIIAPVYANATNGYQWDQGKRTAFANDPLNLIPVGRATYRNKRQRGIGSWRPREEYLCEYARAWQAVSEKYELDLANRDQNRMKRILDDCGGAESRDASED